MRTAMRWALVLVVAAGMLAGGGCKEDEVTPPATVQFPDSPEALMAAFQAAYEEMDIELFREVVAAEFACYLNQSTIDDFALPRDHFDHDEEITIAERQFSGGAYVRGDGTIVPGVTRIVFTYLAPETAWEVSPGDDRIPDALRAQYRVEATIEQGNAGRMQIRGIIEFYVRAEQVDVGGSLRTRYRMVGQVDYTYGGWAKRPVEDTTWGEFKALFR